MSKAFSYDGVIVFAAPRTGSTFLVEMLTHVLQAKHKKDTFKNLYEVFESSSAFTSSWDPITVDRYEWIPRPYINGVLYQRLHRLSTANIIPVFKIFMQDFEGENYKIYENLFSSARYFKIILNRYDVTSQIISYVLSKYSNIWHIRNQTMRNQYEENSNKKFEVDLDHVYYIGRNIINLYAWQLFNDTVTSIWYEDLPAVEIPELQISRHDTLSYESDQQKMNSNHVERLKATATNALEVLTEISKLERSISKVRDMVRNKNATA